MLLVTGGAGFIGSNVLASLNEAGRADIAVNDILGHDGKEVALANNLDDPSDAADGVLVDAFEAGANRGRPHDAPMQHFRDAEILHVDEGARDLGRKINTPDRLADKLESASRLSDSRGIAQSYKKAQL